ncbi:MAG TPA: helical backbone metal receptor [Anaerohalosphaeraceae bacterium]|nr:helical backbone metal receptor [Anaerohalosphaeraceae bacterium]HPO68705.1 helical backbone metal receptor [Anaerohalosphaeraceae bacterium]
MEVLHLRNQFLRAVCWSIAVVLWTAVWAGCSKKEIPAGGRPDSSLRIIAMAPNLTEILFALGLDKEIVAVAKGSNYPPAALQKRTVGTFWQPDIEAVLACRPTLVITESFAQQAALAERLRRMGCRTLTLEIETIEQLHQAILTIGDAVHRKEAAEQISTQLKDKQRGIAARCEALPYRPKVLWVIQRQPLRAAGIRAFPNELIETAGGINAIGDTPHQYPPIAAETVLAAKPDVIIETADDAQSLKRQQETASQFYRRFAGVPAVQTGRIYVLDGDLVSRLGPRLAEGMEQVAECLHPKEN